MSGEAECLIIATISQQAAELNEYSLISYNTPVQRMRVWLINSPKVILSNYTKSTTITIGEGLLCAGHVPYSAHGKQYQFTLQQPYAYWLYFTERWKLRQDKQLAQSHTGRTWWHWNWKGWLLTPSVCLSTTLIQGTERASSCKAWLNLKVIKTWMLGQDTPWFKSQLYHLLPKGNRAS